MKNLPPGQADRLRNALVDAEDLLTFHSLNRPENQQKRKISGLVDKITLTAVSSVLGGYVSWSRLSDPRIAMYEVQTSDDSVFSSFDSFQILDTFFSVDGISSTKFVRVRGVRIDGETGLWSDTATLTPNIVAPTTHSIEFYPIYQTPISNPILQKSFIYGGDLDPYREQSFYTVLSDSFYIDRIGGGISIWGYISNRLEKFSNPGITPWDRVRFTVNGIHRMDNYFSHWTNNFEIDDANKTDFVFFYPNEYISFYARGGYTASFGPYGVSVPTITAGTGPNDANRITTQDAPDGTFYWENVYNAKYPSRFDQAQLDSFSDLEFAHEANSSNITAAKKTHWLIFQNFKFNLASTDQILGIKADIKRRQPNPLNDQISPNFGVARPDKLIGDDIVLEHLATSDTVIASTRNVTSIDILEDTSFGRYLDCSSGFGNVTEGVRSGFLGGDPTGDGTDGSYPSTVAAVQSAVCSANNFSVSCWVLFPSPGPSTTTGYTLVFLPGNNGAGDRSTITLQLQANSSNITQWIGQVAHQSPISGTVNAQYTSLSAGDAAFNKFHHVVLTWDKNNGSNGTLNLYVNNVLVKTGTASGNWDKTYFTNINRQIRIASVAVIGGDSRIGAFSGGIAQVAIWDKVLDADEIDDIFELKGGANYAKNFKDYQSSNKLNHYFLRFPQKADVSDSQIRLVDNTGVRTDLENKAITTESWPQLGQFFYTDTRVCDLPLASSDGIPHDNHLAIGYQSYGDQFDFWRADSWTPDQINDFYFGLAIQAQNVDSGSFTADAYVDHAKITIFTLPDTDREIDFAVSVSSANQFYLQRECFGALFNAIEVGEKLGDIVS